MNGIYNQTEADRAAAIALDRGTNYGVVRLELLEYLYEKVYMQRLRNPDEEQWRCRIIPNRAVISLSDQVTVRTVTLVMHRPRRRNVQRNQRSS